MARPGAPAPQLLPLERTDALSIGALYNRIQGALARAFPGGKPLWVRGEIQSLSDRTGHCYVDLVDPDAERGRDTPVLKVKCWRTTWAPLRKALDDQGVVLEPGAVVTWRGRVDFYRPRGEISFVVDDVDVSALVGQQAARRAALLRTLEREGLLTANRARSVPAPPLRVGLVASPDTEGYRDFTGQLLDSGYGFAVTLAPAQVQGTAAPRSVAVALRALAGRPLDLAVVVRGGGSRGDLVAFDAEPVARAIAASPVAVWTGIGHSGDQSVADLVANRSFITPTECGQELVRAVADWWQDAARSARRVAARTAEALYDADRRDRAARLRLVACTRSQIARHADRLAGRAGRIALDAPRCLDTARADVARRSLAVGPRLRGRLDHEHDRVVAWRRLLVAYDVDRQLERGYTLTTDATGRILRSVAGLTAGADIVTRFADGSARSRVAGTTVAESPAATSSTDLGPRPGGPGRAGPADDPEPAQE